MCACSKRINYYFSRFFKSSFMQLFYFKLFLKNFSECIVYRKNDKQAANFCLTFREYKISRSFIQFFMP